MPLPRVRFTVRRLMVAVAVVGALLGAVRLAEERSVAFRRLALEHGRLTYAYDWEEIADVSTERNLLEAYRPDAPPPDRLAAIRRRLYRARDRAAHHTRLAEKYDRAARYPFLPVAPDPPEPTP